MQPSKVWSKALELKDKETKGHSDRVMDLACKLAVHIGFPESQMIHFRRGVFLHDIGKMGVPDQILLKGEALTPTEWKVMRQHPVSAYNLLDQIDYLKPSLDIPYCHHERWDGSGYPRQLRGEEIPLAARVFSVVDVWDALVSDRPYRQGWSHEEARKYIRKNSGILFDPAIVDLFFELLDA